MKIILHIIVLMILLGSVSCKKVIDINLNNSHPQYIVEGAITNNAGPYNIRLTRSVNFSDDNNVPGVANALVVVSDDMGGSDTLSYTENGYYKTRSIQGILGHTYTMKISVDGQLFYATSTMPYPVAFDSLFVVNETSMGKQFTTPYVVFSDPAATVNYYNFIVYKNNKRAKQLLITNDQFNDGQTIISPFQDMDSTYSSNDNIRVEMQGISEKVYDYYSSLQETIGQSSATPANPVSNVSGGNVLGYFSAHTAQERSMIVR